jgi:hypothetical protein
VDDYLHQAADSSLWPAGISYDPDADGILIPSLGVHEHWNDSLHKQYTRDLGTGFGIELYKVHDGGSGIAVVSDPLHVRVFPSITDDYVTISSADHETTAYIIYDMHGKACLSGDLSAGNTKRLDLTQLQSGAYILRFCSSVKNTQFKIIKQ